MLSLTLENIGAEILGNIYTDGIRRAASDTAKIMTCFFYTKCNSCSSQYSILKRKLSAMLTLTGDAVSCSKLVLTFRFCRIIKT